MGVLADIAGSLVILALAFMCATATPRSRGHLELPPPTAEHGAGKHLSLSLTAAQVARGKGVSLPCAPASGRRVLATEKLIRS